LPRVKVSSNIQGAIKVLENQANKTLNERIDLFRLNNCKDIESFFKIPKDERKYPDGKKDKIDLGRKIIVIDEAAEAFRVTSYANASDITKARNSAAKIAAQGRALGVHLIIATQKPNVKSVDGNIKTNLTGRICFRMADIASSNTILDNKRAADLSKIQGRAVWRCDSELKEIQTPLMLEDTASALLGKYYKKLTKFESKNVLAKMEEARDE
jgi:DNA segregation ATPase FtsK/SpoIIIE-like protein